MISTIRTAFVKIPVPACLVLLLAGIVLTSACRPQQRWNVLLVTFDTTRADHLGYQYLELSGTVDMRSHDGGKRTTFHLPVRMSATKTIERPGSRPEGAIIYDYDRKLHSHHDSDPAAGQNNAFDLVRLHYFGALDQGNQNAPMSERPSYRKMTDWARRLPVVRTVLAEDEFAHRESISRM